MRFCGWHHVYWWHMAVSRRYQSHASLLPSRSFSSLSCTSCHLHPSFFPVTRHNSLHATNPHSCSLHQRGGKTLKDRTRFVQVEARLDDLSKSIGRTRRELAQKPC